MLFWISFPKPIPLPAVLLPTAPLGRAGEEQAGPGTTCSAPRLPGGSFSLCGQEGLLHAVQHFCFALLLLKLFFKQLCAADVLSPTCAFALSLMTFFLCRQ